MVVACVVVNMVNCCCVLRVRVRAKRLCHQSAHKEMTRYAILTECHTPIALVVHKRFQEAWFQVFQALDASLVADKILALISFYRLPLFVRKVRNFIHSFMFLSHSIGWEMA